MVFPVLLTTYDIEISTKYRGTVEAKFLSMIFWIWVLLTRLQQFKIASVSNIVIIVTITVSCYSSASIATIATTVVIAKIVTIATITAVTIFAKLHLWILQVCLTFLYLHIFPHFAISDITIYYCYLTCYYYNCTCLNFCC